MSRRDLFGFAAASLVVVAGCSSGQSGREPASTGDNPVLPIGTAPAAPPTSVAPVVASSSPSSIPAADVATTSTTPVPAGTVSPAAEPTETTTPVAAVQLPPGALPVPVEGQEPYQLLGSIRIPAIKIDAPLGEGVTLTNLDRGPGHWPGTALPGELGNVVIGGHRVSHSHPFRDLDKLAAGDVVTMAIDAGEFTYTVTTTEITLPTDVQVLEQTNAHHAILFACTPKGETTHRIIVHLNME